MSGSAERSEGTRSGASRSSEEVDTARAATPKSYPNETVERPKRRSFTAEYKLRILKLADEATEPGAIGELLRREGLYSSHLAGWRRGRDAGVKAGLVKRRGPAAKQSSDTEKMRAMQREIDRLKKRLAQSELLVEVQKKLHALMGDPVDPDSNDESRP